MNYNSVDILLVDDNLNDVELAIRELNKNHFANTVFHVKDGEEALEFIYGIGRFKHTRNINIAPKLILLDIHMPKMSGIELLEKIKSDELTKNIPVVMLTSSNEHPDIEKCYALGANSYIVKPVNFEGFAEAVKHLGFYWLLLNQPPVKSGVVENLS